MTTENTGTPNGNDQGAGSTGAADSQSQNQNVGDQHTPRPGADQNRVQADPRHDGMLRDLRTERAARQKLEADLAALREESTTRNRAMAEALGVAEPESAQVRDAIRRQFAEVYPELHELVEAGISAKDLKDLIANAQSMRSVTDQHYLDRGQQVVDTIVGEVSREIGGDLNDDQIDELANAYVRYVLRGDQLLKQRHEREPLKVAKEFAQKYAERWFAPARRKLAAANERIINGRRIPQGGRTGPVVQGQKKVDYNNEDEFKNALRESFRNGVNQ